MITQEPVRGDKGKLAGTVLHVHYKTLDTVGCNGAGECDTSDGKPDNKAPLPLDALPTPQEDAASYRGEHDLLGVVPDDKQQLDDAFATFYNAGLPKKNRKNAEKSFMRVARRQDNPTAFAEMLAANIQARLLAGETGFEKLHPASYLNQERWLDEIDSTGSLASLHGCPDEALYQLFATVMREQNLPHKVPSQGFDIFRGTRAHQDMLVRWDKLFNTYNPDGRLRYNDAQTGLAFWRYAFEVVAKKQNFRQSDVTISNFFHPDVFHRAIEGNLKQHGAAR